MSEQHNTVATFKNPEATPVAMKEQIGKLRSYMDAVLKYLSDLDAFKEKSNKDKKDKVEVPREPSPKTIDDASKELFKSIRGAADGWNLAISFFPKLNELKSASRQKGKTLIEQHVLCGMNANSFSSFRSASEEDIKKYFPIIYDACSAFDGNPPYKTTEAKSVICGAKNTNGSFMPMPIQFLKWIFRAMLICGMDNEYRIWCTVLQQASREDKSENKQLQQLQQDVLNKFSSTLSMPTNSSNVAPETNGTVELQQSVIEDLKTEIENLKKITQNQEAQIANLESEKTSIFRRVEEVEKKYSLQIEANERLVEQARTSEQELQNKLQVAMMRSDEAELNLQQQRRENDEKLRTAFAAKQVAEDQLSAIEADLRQFKHDLEFERSKAASIETDVKERLLAELIRKINDSLNHFFGYLADWREREKSEEDKDLNDCYQDDINLICTALTEIGATQIGVYEGEIPFDSSTCTSDVPLHDGQKAIVQQIGWQYGTYVIQKAYVIKEEDK